MSTPPEPSQYRVLAVSSNKGGVGKTTIATNLAVYLRALHEELPILLMSLDDQGIVDRMFALGEDSPEANFKHGWAERSFERVVRLGQYGVHYVPSAPNTSLLKGRAEDPRTLARILARSDWRGLVILDAKSDLEALTRNALQAADLALLPVADWASLEEAGKALAILERAGRRETARVLMTLVDRRTRVDAEEELAGSLRAEIEERGWPLLATSISRSPRVEALNSGRGKHRTILHHAQGTLVHREFRALAEEVGRDLGLGGGRPRSRAGSRPAVAARSQRGVAGLKAALLRGVGRD